jgi:hypothetical protein
MDTLLKLLLIAAIVGILWSSARFRNMSRELDNSALISIRRMMVAAEECGFPAEIVPLLIILTALSFVISAVVTAGVGR